MSSCTPVDEDFVPIEISLSNESISTATETATSLCSALNASPMMYHIKKKRISELSESTKQKLRQKLCRMQKNLESQFAEAIAPGQSEEFIENVLHANTEEGKTETIPDDLQVQIKMYKDSDSLGKHVILSLINHSKYSKEQIMNFFQCSRWQVDQARKLQAQSCFTVPHKQKITRSRVPQEKIEHFMEFLLSSGLLQDVAYGINNIKFENGERQKVSNAILTMRCNHTISYY